MLSYVFIFVKSRVLAYSYSARMVGFVMHFEDWHSPRRILPWIMILHAALLLKLSIFKAINPGRLLGKLAARIFQQWHALGVRGFPNGVEITPYCGSAAPSEGIRARLLSICILKKEAIPSRCLRVSYLLTRRPQYHSSIWLSIEKKFGAYSRFAGTPCRSSPC